MWRDLVAPTEALAVVWVRIYNQDRRRKCRSSCAASLPCLGDLLGQTLRRPRCVEREHRPVELMAEPGLLPLGVLPRADARWPRPPIPACACREGTRPPPGCRCRRARARAARAPPPAPPPPPRSGPAAPSPPPAARSAGAAPGRGAVSTMYHGSTAPAAARLLLPPAQRAAGEQRDLDRPRGALASAAAKSRVEPRRPSAAARSARAAPSTRPARGVGRGRAAARERARPPAPGYRARAADHAPAAAPARAPRRCQPSASRAKRPAL